MLALSGRTWRTRLLGSGGSTEPEHGSFREGGGLWSVQEEVPDARGLDPGDVGGGAGEHAGLVLHRAADGPEAHHAVHLPAVPAQLAQQGAPGVALGERRSVTKQP